MDIKVLLADDHRIVREGLKMILETHNDIKVLGETENGFETINKVKEMKPDIIIMDISMPGLNGIETTRIIANENPKIKIIILSMYATTEDIFQALQAGAYAYLVKESAGKEVVDAIYAAYNGRRYFSRIVDDIIIDTFMFKHQKQSPQSPLERLSRREKEVLQLVVQGKSSNEIANLLSLSAKTIVTYRSRLMQKIGVKNLIDLLNFAVHHNLIKQ